MPSGASACGDLLVGGLRVRRGRTRVGIDAAGAEVALGGDLVAGDVLGVLLRIRLAAVQALFLVGERDHADRARRAPCFIWPISAPAAMVRPTPAPSSIAPVPRSHESRWPPISTTSFGLASRRGSRRSRCARSPCRPSRSPAPRARVAGRSSSRRVSCSASGTDSAADGIGVRPSSKRVMPVCGLRCESVPAERIRYAGRTGADRRRRAAAAHARAGAVAAAIARALHRVVDERDLAGERARRGRFQRGQVGEAHDLALDRAAPGCRPARSASAAARWRRAPARCSLRRSHFGNVTGSIQTLSKPSSRNFACAHATARASASLPARRAPTSVVSDSVIR